MIYIVFLVELKKEKEIVYALNTNLKIDKWHLTEDMHVIIIFCTQSLPYLTDGDNFPQVLLSAFIIFKIN